MVRRISILILVSILLLACNKEFFTTSELPKIKTHSLEDYELYVFQMVRKKRDVIHIDSLAPKFVSGADFTHKTKKDLVYEELYVLLEKEGKHAIYLTTISHKYIYDEGVYNNSFYQQHIPINNIDFIYLGYYDDTKISFYNPNGRSYSQNLVLYYTKRKDTLEITNVTNDYAKEKDRKANPYLTFNSVFDLNFKFVNETYRTLVYQHLDAYGNVIDEKTNINRIHENGTSVYFEMDTENTHKYQVFQDRVRFTYPLPE